MREDVGLRNCKEECHSHPCPFVTRVSVQFKPLNGLNAEISKVCGQHPRTLAPDERGSDLGLATPNFRWGAASSPFPISPFHLNYVFCESSTPNTFSH